MEPSNECLPTICEGEGKTLCRVEYSEGLVARILSMFAEGKSLYAISKMAEMPGMNTLYNWQRKNAEFRQALLTAQSAHAHSLEGKAIEAAEAAADAAGEKEQVAAGRLLFDAYKWGAEINDPNKYGKKVTVGGDSTNPIRIVVSTGFPEPNKYQTPPVLGADGLMEIADARTNDSERGGVVDGVYTEAATAGAASEPAPVQCGGVPPEVREVSVCNQPCDRQDPPEQESSTQSSIPCPDVRSGKAGDLGLSEEVHGEDSRGGAQRRGLAG